MADIELVIKIDEEDYKTMKHNVEVYYPLPNNSPNYPLFGLNKKSLVLYF